jgi:hypothetical protein
MRQLPRLPAGATTGSRFFLLRVLRVLGAAGAERSEQRGGGAWFSVAAGRGARSEAGWAGDGRELLPITLFFI